MAIPQHAFAALKRLPRRLALLLAAFCVHANASPLFEDDTVLEMALTGPLTGVIEDDEQRNERRFALLADGTEHAIKVRLRGNSRVRVCDFPPLRLNFAGSHTAQTLFAGQDKLKLVTHCRDGRSATSQVIKEYAAYRIFNLISDVSYRVRLVRIQYSDTDARSEPAAAERYGFVIESSAELAQRTNAQPASATGVSLASLAERQAARVFIFHYLIGNTDWSLVTADSDDECCHNGDLFDIDADRYLVPYDFDLSGLVNARYAKPDPSLRISRVTQRLYRGYCISDEAVAGALTEIEAKRETILAVVREAPGFAEKDRATTERYLERFFREAQDKDKLLKKFARACL